LRGGLGVPKKALAAQSAQNWFSKKQKLIVRCKGKSTKFDCLSGGSEQEKKARSALNHDNGARREKKASVRGKRDLGEGKKELKN